MKNEKREKIKRELEELKDLRALDDLMKKADVETTFLANPASESELAGEEFAESMLDRYNISRSDMRALDALERMSVSSPSRKRVRRARGSSKRARRSARRARRGSKRR